MKRRSLFFFAALSCLLLAPAHSQSDPTASVEVEVDRSEITIGDRIEYRIHITYDPGVEIQKPGWGQGLETFQILDFQRGTPEKVGERWETTDVYTLSTFTPEDYILPPVQVPVRLPSGATQVLETQPIAVKVSSVLPDDETVFEIKDIRNPVAVYSGVDWMRLAVIGGVLLLVAAAALLYWRLKKRPLVQTILPPPRPEHELAFERLRALRDRVEGWGPTPDAPLCREYGLELSETLREYLEKRLDILALEMTTEQLADHFKHSPLDRKKGEGSLDEILLGVLHWTDILKFAKGTDTRENLLSRITEAERLIDGTKRVREEVSPPGDAVREAA